MVMFSKIKDQFNIELYKPHTRGLVIWMFYFPNFWQAVLSCFVNFMQQNDHKTNQSALPSITVRNIAQYFELLMSSNLQVGVGLLFEKEFLQNLLQVLNLATVLFVAHPVLCGHLAEPLIKKLKNILNYCWNVVNTASNSKEKEIKSDGSLKEEQWAVELSQRLSQHNDLNSNTIPDLQKLDISQPKLGFLEINSINNPQFQHLKLAPSILDCPNPFGIFDAITRDNFQLDSTYKQCTRCNRVTCTKQFSSQANSENTESIPACPWAGCWQLACPLCGGLWKSCRFSKD